MLLKLLYHNFVNKSRRSLVYHQFRKELHIINTECCISSSRRQNARWRVMRYKGGSPPLMICTALRAAMICQACGLDRKKHLLSQVLFSGLPERIRTFGLQSRSLTRYPAVPRAVIFVNYTPLRDDCQAKFADATTLCFLGRS